MTVTTLKRNYNVCFTEKEVGPDIARSYIEGLGKRMATVTEVLTDTRRYAIDVSVFHAFVDRKGAPSTAGWYHVNRDLGTLVKVREGHWPEGTDWYDKLLVTQLALPEAVIGNLNRGEADGILVLSEEFKGGSNDHLLLGGHLDMNGNVAYCEPDFNVTEETANLLRIAKVQRVEPNQEIIITSPEGSESRLRVPHGSTVRIADIRR